MQEKSEGLKTTLWVVIVIASSSIAFLLGYSVSAFTGIQTQTGNIELETGGYGSGSDSGESESGADDGDYGAFEPDLEESGEELEPGEAEEESKELLY